MNGARLLRIVLVVVWALAACTTPTAVPPVSNGTGLPQGYPASGQSGTGQPTPTPLPTPTSDPALGSVRGTLQLNGEPVTGYILYLGELLTDDAGQESVVALDQANSPSTTTTSEGQFHFVNVPPGRYGLILTTVTASFHLMYPGSNDSIIATVTAGNEVDLGVLNFDTLPIPAP